MKLSKVEEQELKDWLRELDRFGIHFSHKIIAGYANDILEARNSSDTVGHTWIRKFMHQFPELKTVPSEKKDVLQNTAERDPVWLDRLFQILDIARNPPYNVKHWNMANMDEKGFLMGVP
ncbi:hypothetical protein BT96DRAFT_1001564 [Gymnopus androsaceus JB14]|uniref:HTH CENPB-type domain-containing protein n=1 Tax=Gymnopus androsaceus JB14 TaxID=1447944 RepID=A0A6A4GZ50_9AGAR|nr:hypothetical protein BT96DRAFT_1001564 [Gymnopus androsaceus JB14]